MKCFFGRQMYIIFANFAENSAMKYNYSKIEPIYNYYLRYGFERSLQEVANAVHITKKTLFNRYISKEYLILCLIHYWQTQSCKRLEQRMEFANNAVEKVMMFLFELQYCKKNENFFFQKTKTLFLEEFEQSSPHIKQLETIFRLGIKENLFRFDSDPILFAYFFQFNTLFLLLSHDLIYTEYIAFLFEPILTETGMAVFKDIEIEQIFKIDY
jgi:AcrR family transcriptional regulator